MLELKIQKRDILGKKVRTLRNDGLIPAELYGNRKENSHVMVDEREFIKIYKEAGESLVITLDLNGEKVPALIYGADFDPLGQKYLHIDFYAVKMDEKIITEVPVEFIGESPAVKGGGVLVKSMQEIEVEALPADLPKSVEADLSVLNQIHDVISVKDLKLSDKIKILSDAEAVIATVVEVAKEEEAPVMSVEDVKVEGEEKKKEEGGEQATE